MFIITKPAEITLKMKSDDHIISTTSKSATVKHESKVELNSKYFKQIIESMTEGLIQMNTKTDHPVMFIEKANKIKRKIYLAPMAEGDGGDAESDKEA